MNKYLFFISIFFLSCQEEITLNLPQADEKLVVQGTIESGFPPIIILTRNQGYFDPINENTLENLYIEDAIVKIWKLNPDSTRNIIELYPKKIDTLVVYTVSESEYNFYLGTRNFEYSENGQTYNLDILWNDETISAITTIPMPTELDCVWVEQSRTADEDYKYDIRAIYSDPINVENNILIKSKRLQHFKWDKQQLQNVYSPDILFKLIDTGSDLLVNGETFETYFPKPKERGFPDGAYNIMHTRESSNGTQIEFDNDIVLINFCQIDEPSLKFWRGLRRQDANGNNPFAEPLNLVSNINNGLGVFTGYGSTYYKVQIIKGTTINMESEVTIFDIF
jgi:predicted DNA binding protein